MKSFLVVFSFTLFAAQYGTCAAIGRDNALSDDRQETDKREGAEAGPVRHTWIDSIGDVTKALRGGGNPGDAVKDAADKVVAVTTGGGSHGGPVEGGKVGDVVTGVGSTGNPAKCTTDKVGEGEDLEITVECVFEYEEGEGGSPGGVAGDKEGARDATQPVAQAGGETVGAD